MSIVKLILRSLAYYRKKQISVILGVALSSAVLIGALIVGDSVRYSLQRIVDKRLGKVQYSLSSGDRVFRKELAEILSDKLKNTCSAVLYTKGVIVTEGGQGRLNNINFYGVDENFDALGPEPGVYIDIAPDEIIINSYAASKLNLTEGDEVLLRFEKFDSMPKDSPLSDDSEITVAARFKIKFIVGDETFGRFGLKAEQIAPFNVFLPVNKLASLMDIEGSANTLLVSDTPSGDLTLEKLNAALNDAWNIEDSGIELSLLPRSYGTELRSSRIFLDEPVIEASRNSGVRYEEVLTYFVNEIASGNKAAPYSFVSAAGPEILNSDLSDNEIIINNWLANDLGVRKGAELKLKYFTLGNNRNLQVDSSSFIVSSVVNMTGIYADTNFLPDYPGLSESESCLDWHPGIPIDFDKIRKKDELYWEKYKGTPKAFISLNKAKEIWQNRFGDITAIRFDTKDIGHLTQSLNANLNPSEWNIQFINVREEGLEASEQSVDFGGLFIGLSFFVIISALLLTGMMFHFNLDSRSSETGLFLGVGLQSSLIKKLIYTEAGILVLIGSLLGAVAGIFYNNLILIALGTIWSDAVGTSSLEVNIITVTVITGIVIMLVLNSVVIWLNVRKTVSQNVHSLQRGITKLDYKPAGQNKKYLILSLVSFLAAALLTLGVDHGKGSTAFGHYFLTGILIMVSGVTLSAHLINRSGKSRPSAGFTFFDLVVKEITRKKSRSILLITLLGSALFIVFTVGINKKIVDENDMSNESGTGGYSLFGETSVPVFKDLNDAEFRKELDIARYSYEDLRFVQMKVKTGEDASCLNLNRVKNPQVLAVNPEEFSDRGAFTFVSFIPEVDLSDPWSILDQSGDGNVIYGIADASVIQWQLGKAIGDTLYYMDDSGSEFGVILAAGLENSIFQGNLLLSESQFLSKFPAVSGSRLFIVESPTKDITDLSRQLNYSMQDYGLNLTTTIERLAEFNKIENTYLSIFLILGSFGILIGSLGIGLIVYRNVSEQNREFALLQAVGFSISRINRFINSAYAALLFYGTAIGIAAAVAASLPSLFYANSELPYTLIILILLMIMSIGLGSIFVTTGKSVKGDVSQLLRNE